MEEQQGKEKAGIACVEVLVSKRCTESDIYWALSVYSLQNQPLRKNLDIQHTELYHFMAFDWERTVKRLLDVHSVPYSVVQRFMLGDLRDACDEISLSPEVQAAWLEAAKTLAHDDASTEEVDEWLVS